MRSILIAFVCLFGAYLASNQSEASAQCFGGRCSVQSTMSSRASVSRARFQPIRNVIARKPVRRLLGRVFCPRRCNQQSQAVSVQQTGNCANGQCEVSPVDKIGSEGEDSEIVPFARIKTSDGKNIEFETIDKTGEVSEAPLLIPVSP